MPAHRLLRREDVAPRTFSALLDETRGDPALRRDVESAWTDDPGAACLVAAKAVAQAPCPGALVDVAFRRRGVPSADAACSVMGRGFVFVEAAWADAADDVAACGWVDDTLSSLNPIETGAYVNETNWVARPDRLARAFNARARARLRTIARSYDPDTLFCSTRLASRLPD